MSDSEDDSASDHQLKFVLIGDGAAGKVSTSFRPCQFAYGQNDFQFVLI